MRARENRTDSDRREGDSDRGATRTGGSTGDRPEHERRPGPGGDCGPRDRRAAPFTARRSTGAARAPGAAASANRWREPAPSAPRILPSKPQRASLSAARAGPPYTALSSAPEGAAGRALRARPAATRPASRNSGANATTRVGGGRTAVAPRECRGPTLVGSIQDRLPARCAAGRPLVRGRSHASHRRDCAQSATRRRKMRKG